jgi:hypothetical protein
MQILRAWKGGPLREFSAAPPPKEGRWTPYHTIPDDPDRAYTRSLVCDGCQKAVPGLYQPRTADLSAWKWLCSECRDSATEKREQPKHLRRARCTK